MTDQEDSIAARFESLKIVFDEKTRRLWAAAEAQSVGANGVMIVNRATGIAPVTIRRGMEELSDPEALKLSVDRTRAPGGGRKKTVDTNVELKAALDRSSNP